MKTCNTCKNTKPLSDFHRCAKNADGKHINCKDCRNAAQREYYRTKDKEAATRRMRAWRRKHNKSYHAHIAVNTAVAAGVLEKPTSCSRCGKQAHIIDAHHDNYNKPLKVEWVCRSCHRAIHRTQAVGK